MIGSSSASSSAERTIWTAPTFSSSRAGLRVPGIGTTVSPCTWARWCTQASATCAGVAPWASAIRRTGSSRAALVLALSPVKRGWYCRKSSLPRSFPASANAPVRKPRPSGEYGTSVTPSSAATGTALRSRSRLKSDHSDWRAAIGCTACASRSSGPVTSLSPSCLTLPSSTSSAIAPTDSANGTRGSWRCM